VCEFIVTLLLLTLSLLVVPQIQYQIDCRKFLLKAKVKLYKIFLCLGKTVTEREKSPFSYFTTAEDNSTIKNEK